MFMLHCNRICIPVPYQDMKSISRYDTKKAYGGLLNIISLFGTGKCLRHFPSYLGAIDHVIILGPLLDCWYCTSTCTSYIHFHVVVMVISCQDSGYYVSPRQLDIQRSRANISWYCTKKRVCYFAVYRDTSDQHNILSPYIKCG